MNAHISIELDEANSFLIGRRNAEGTLCFAMRYLSGLWSIPSALADYRQSFDISAWFDTCLVCGGVGKVEDDEQL